MRFWWFEPQFLIKLFLIKNLSVLRHGYLLHWKGEPHAMSRQWGHSISWGFLSGSVFINNSGYRQQNLHTTRTWNYVSVVSKFHCLYPGFSCNLRQTNQESLAAAIRIIDITSWADYYKNSTPNFKLQFLTICFIVNAKSQESISSSNFKRQPSKTTLTH